MPLPRYFFHTENGRRLRDSEGTELADLAAARREAIAFLGDSIRTRGSPLIEDGCFRIIVTDESEAPLFTVTAAIENAPE
jgi:hypothetical protein